MVTSRDTNLRPYLAKPEQIGLPVRKRRLTSGEILRGIDKANREAREASEEIRERLRRATA